MVWRQTDVSGKQIASIFKIEDYAKQTNEQKQAVSSSQLAIIPYDHESLIFKSSIYITFHPLQLSLPREDGHEE
jgi:hypothetical protein